MRTGVNDLFGQRVRLVMNHGLRIRSKSFEQASTIKSIATQNIAPRIMAPPLQPRQAIRTPSQGDFTFALLLDGLENNRDRGQSEKLDVSFCAMAFKSHPKKHVDTLL